MDDPATLFAELNALRTQLRVGRVLSDRDTVFEAIDLFNLKLVRACTACKDGGVSSESSQGHPMHYRR